MSSENQIEYRQLGKSGLRVSVPILGAMSFGLKDPIPWVIEEDEALKILKAAWDKGINTFDTANNYSNGESERIIAKFIEKNSIPRGNIIIATKVCHLVREGGRSGNQYTNPEWLLERDAQNQYGLSRSAIFNQVEGCLKRLKTDCIDLLQIHRFDSSTPVEETMKALHDLVQSGKVRYIGASSMRTWQFAMMNETAGKHGWTKFVSMQDEHSLMYREEEREMIPYCKFNGIGIIPWGPLDRGAVARPFSQSTARSEWMASSPFGQAWGEPKKEINKRVEELANKKGWSMAQVGIAWSKAKITSPIVGINSEKRVEESILPKGKYVLTEDEMKYLEEPYVPLPVRGHA